MTDLNNELSFDELDNVSGGTFAEVLGHATNAAIMGALETACVVLQGAVTIGNAMTPTKK